MTRAPRATLLPASGGERRGALLRSPEQCLEEVRQGLRGAAGALGRLRKQPSQTDALRLVAHLHGLHAAGQRLAASLQQDQSH